MNIPVRNGQRIHSLQLCLNKIDGNLAYLPTTWDSVVDEAMFREFEVEVLPVDNLRRFETLDEFVRSSMPVGLESDLGRVLALVEFARKFNKEHGRRR